MPSLDKKRRRSLSATRSSCNNENNESSNSIQQKILQSQKSKKASSLMSRLLPQWTPKSIPECVEFVKNFLFNYDQIFHMIIFLIPIEFFLNLFIVYRVPYTEIDWVAYMQEVEGFLNGTLNYYELKGDTGPLVYPAGFVYVYSLLYSVTQLGKNVKLGQYIFIGIYMFFITIVFAIYKRTKRVPPIALALMTLTSHRIHSIFVLRLFNDPIAMLLLYASIMLLLNKNYRVGCILFSLAVSVKMNVLLFAPGLFVILMLTQGFLGTLQHIGLCALVQLILGAPFLLSHPFAYIHRSFDLGRQFFFVWTVNWKFLPEPIFHSKLFQLSLLALHLVILALFVNKLLRNVGVDGIRGLFFSSSSSKRTKQRQPQLSTDFVLFIMFASNYVGICFSRSLHYQFYVWYYHTIAYLIWSTNYPNALRFLLFGLIEFCWNVYPSNFYSSLTLNACHLTLLAGLWGSISNNDNNKLKLN